MASKVNQPVDRAVRDRDIENKLRLYGIWEAFSLGKLPSNKQIDVALNSLINNKQLQEPNSALSEEGKSLLQDFCNVVAQAKTLILIKNHDEILQEFIWHTEQLGLAGEAPGSAGAPTAPVSNTAAQKDKEDVLRGLRTLGTLIVSNGQFRKLFSDVQILLRDIAGDAAQNVAHHINPSEEQLAQIDRPAQDNVWHDVPDLSKENLKQQFRQNVERSKPFQRGDVRDAAGSAAQAALEDSQGPQGPQGPQEDVSSSTGEQRYGTESSIGVRSGVQTGAGHLFDRTRENIPEEHQDRAKRLGDSARKYFGDRFHEDRRKQSILRLKKMVVEIQGHPEYQEAVDTLLRLAENYSGHLKAAVGEGRSQVSGAREDNHLRMAEKHLKTLIERFANYTSLDDITDAINDIYRDTDKDPELRSWFRRMDSYTQKCLKTQGYILTDEATLEWNNLYDDGVFLLRERYRGHTDRVVNEFKFLIDQFAQDPESKQLSNSLQRLFTNLGNDENGKPTFKKHLIKDITTVIIPDIFESMRYVPIPRIEYSDPMIDAVIENLVIESDNLMPNLFEISNDSYFRWGRKNVSKLNRQSFMVSISGIQCDFRDVSYYIKKKQGFPRISDIGVADFLLGGAGLGLKLHLTTASKPDRVHFFKCDKVDVTVSNLSVSLKQSKHKVLFSILSPLLVKVMKPVITRVVAKQIQDYLVEVDAFAWRVYQEQEKAKCELDTDPESSPNIYRRYVQSIRNELLRKKQAKGVVADKKVKLVMTQADSLEKFKNISLPGGISTKATEYKEMARRGERWHSDVFSIGSASETQGVSSPKPITRQSPHAHQAQVRDRPSAPSDPTCATPTGYNATSRASRDSGYHGVEPVAPKPETYTKPDVSATGTDYSASDLSSKLEQSRVGTTGSNVAGKYDLKSPLGRNPMVQDNKTRDIPAFEGGY